MTDPRKAKDVMISSGYVEKPNWEGELLRYLKTCTMKSKNKKTKQNLIRLNVYTYLHQPDASLGVISGSGLVVIYVNTFVVRLGDVVYKVVQG